jgi:MFS family permease
VSFGITFGTRYIDGEESWRLPFVLIVISALTCSIGNGRLTVLKVVPGLVTGIGAIILPYSPRWLALRFENQQALFSLAKIRQLSADDCKVQNEWMEIRVEAAYQREISETQHPRLQQRSHINGIKLELTLWLDCFRSRYWERTHLSIGLMCFQQFVGINAVAYNVSVLIGTLEAGYYAQVALPVILGSVQFLGALSCLWTIDTVGRKRLLVYGSCVMLVCLVIIAGLNSQFSYNWAFHQDAAWICVGFSILCTWTFGATWSPISWALPSEIFPSRLRAKGSALSACSYWL